MKKSKNNTWLIILMIISQIMLTGLLVQWLRSQWQSEKESFRKDLNLKFIESVDQVMDSMLVKHIIVPVLNDTTLTEEHKITFNKSLQTGKGAQSQHVTAFFNDTGRRKETMVTITMPDSGKIIQKDDLSFRSYDSSEKNMLLRTVRLIIRHTGDSAGNQDRFIHMISDAPDTTLLKSLFQKKIGKSGKQFNILWITDSVKNKSNKPGPVLYLKTSVFDKPVNVEIASYQMDILRGISPQILFALTLLIFTAASFFFTWRSLKKQETLNTLRNDFISNISHELKTPVSTVSVALEALKNFDRLKDPVKSNEYLNIAFNEMKRLDLLISQVLNTSVLEDQHAYIKTEETDLVKLTKEVINSMQVRFVQNLAKVEFNAKPESIILDLDRLHIQGVLFNLLDNSLKYCSDNPEINIRVEQKTSAVVLTIGDNGPGIPKEYISKVFDKFFRVPKGDVHNIKGYGLGLSFAELVMKHHNGSIIVRNKNEGGCEFTLIFPGVDK
jgi:signal transduction histidine kinase